MSSHLCLSYNGQMRLLFAVSVLLGALLFRQNSVMAQTPTENTTEYSSSYDESLTFRKMTFLPSIDNINGIYSKAVDEQLKKLIEANHRWDSVESHIAGSVVKPEDLVNDPAKVRSLSRSLNSDGFFITEIRKDPKDVHIQLYLFSTRSGELVAEQAQKQLADNTPLILTTLNNLYTTILNKIPYDALIVSRTDNRVTINVGKKDGVTAGQNLTAVKIISAQKHPKRNFLIKSNKVILGQVRVVKVDDYISFADVTSETESGVLIPGVKITGVTKVDYSATPWTKTYTPAEQLLSENNKVVFGKEAREWIAKDPPTFGRVGAGFSLGSFNNSLGLTDGSNIDSKVNVYPRIDLHGEIWITPQFYTDAVFAQGIGQSTNPSGSPSEISNSLSQYRLSFGYNFILKNEFFGPKITFDLGFNSYRMFVDTTSNQGFTTLEYQSVPFGIGGYVPVNPSGTWAIGGKAYFHMFPRLRESPFSSANSNDNSINHFLFYAENKISERLRLNIGLEFLLLSTTFSGQGDRVTPASNSSHRFTLLNTSIDYLF